ncbi:DUF3868 domain-containing protein [Bacteroides heparinolyticus]|uniref:DUF3868 domain-containing protein n=1 Tax=Prevotella heparinolytica TaxID=28113 RepID=UPI0023F8BD85|nr:DUF3868 domain-containing protein [Bacteroides heparinolyticus]MCI6212236.1 DUF3868 domain-containing protein [Bacteroides heparinolyticus]
MKKRYILLLAIVGGLFGFSSDLKSQTDVSVSNFKLVRNGEHITLNMDLDLSRLDVGSNRAVILTPRIVKGNDSLSLPSIGIYGRRRYYYYLRNNGASMITGPNETVLRAERRPEVLNYKNNCDYSAWMDNSQLLIERQDYGCCGDIYAESIGKAGGYFVYVPKFVFVRPEVEVMKSRALSGTAYINFPVSKTEIFPDYLSNATELNKINATIDSVKFDKDIEVTAVSVKGFASPEGSYVQNDRLARLRTDALKAYINARYQLPLSQIATSYEAEDWSGLRAYVEASALAGKSGILAIIDDTSLRADEKENKIKKNYPEDYASLLKECYPLLRHTDYRIEYVIRSFDRPEEVKRLVKTQPQKLSMDEFYLASQDYEPGSDDFNDIFELAVRMYPSDEIANLNAANVAMARGDLKRAAGYIAKAGNSAQAVYARGVYAALSNNFDEATRFFEQAAKENMPEAEGALRQMEFLK